MTKPKTTVKRPAEKPVTEAREEAEDENKVSSGKDSGVEEVESYIVYSSILEENGDPNATLPPTEPPTNDAAGSLPPSHPLSPQGTPEQLSSPSLLPAQRPRGGQRPRSATGANKRRSYVSTNYIICHNGTRN